MVLYRAPCLFSMEPFRFKQFQIRHDQCAMKVGTDGVLLGAWANVESAATVLDIGTGTGLIALMAAQRNAQARIQAVEVETQAYQQACINAAESPWAERIAVHHAAVQDWAAQQAAQQFDYILSNPPFFEIEQHTLTSEANRRIARSTEQLSHTELLQAAAHLLRPQGVFALVLPAQQGKRFIELAKRHALHVLRLAQVAPRQGKPATRWLIELSPTAQELQTEHWAIRNQGKEYHDYTEQYTRLSRAFYLFME